MMSAVGMRFGAYYAMQQDHYCPESPCPTQLVPAGTKGFDDKGSSDQQDRREIDPPHKVRTDVASAVRSLALTLVRWSEEGYKCRPASPSHAR